MKKLIWLLKIAHAVEIGAIQAYDGHWKSTGLKDHERFKIWLIQCEERIHKARLVNLLSGFGAKPSLLLDCTVWAIGTLVGYACYISPRKYKAYGAKVMETMGEGLYDKLTDAALDLELNNLAGEFVRMSHAETKHAIYFKEIS